MNKANQTLKQAQTNSEKYPPQTLANDEIPKLLLAKKPQPWVAN